MFAQEARSKTVWNSQLFKNIMEDIETAVQNEKFEITLNNNNDFIEGTPLGYAIVGELRRREFEVDVCKYSYVTTISWA
jgi:hypothetical protein